MSRSIEPRCVKALGCAQPFQGVMVGAQDYCGPDETMTEVLEARKGKGKGM